MMARKQDFTISADDWTATMARCNVAGRNVSPTIRALLAAYRRLDPALEAEVKAAPGLCELTDEALFARALTRGFQALIET